MGEHPLPNQVPIVVSSAASPVRVVLIARQELAIAAAENHVEIPSDRAVNELLGDVPAAFRCHRVVLVQTRCGSGVSRCRNVKIILRPRFDFFPNLLASHG